VTDTATTATAPNPFNEVLARRVLAAIDANPGRWDQTVYRRKDPQCGTAMCFAGWTVALSDIPMDDGDVFTIWTTGPDGKRHQDNIPDAAARLLGLADHDQYASIMFAAGNTREQLGRYVELLAGPDTRQGLTDLYYSFWNIADPDDDPHDDEPYLGT
jgi:hypothetical protein